MGLDMYAYVGMPGQSEAYGEQYGEDVPEDKKVAEPRRIAYWRKHPNLHGWMEQLWIKKRNAEGNPIVEDPDWGSSFNGVELELTWDDLDELEQAVKNGTLPPTIGFFFGKGADDFYKQDDLDFVKNAKAEVFVGLRVFYNSSW